MFNYIKNKTYILNNISKNIPDFTKNSNFNFTTLTQNISNKKGFNFLSAKNFSYNFKNTTNNSKAKNNNDKFVKLYPKDRVAVMPPCGDPKKLSHFEKRLQKKFNCTDTKIKLATINKIQRKKNLAFVSNHQTKNKYIDLNILGYHFENGNLSIIKHHKESVPISLDRLKLFNKVEKDRNKNIISIEHVRLLNKRNQSDRVDAVTRKKFPVKCLTFEDVEKLRQKKQETKKPTPLDTDYNTAVSSTYKGEDFEEVTKDFLRRII